MYNKNGFKDKNFWDISRRVMGFNLIPIRDTMCAIKKRTFSHSQKIWQIQQSKLVVVDMLPFCGNF